MGVYLYYVVEYIDECDVEMCVLYVYVEVVVVGECGLDYFCDFVLCLV